MQSALAIGIAMFFAAAIVMPGIERYKAWKRGPREVVARRNWRGQYVPDLAIIRFERALKATLLLLFLAGLWVDAVIMVFPYIP